MSREMNMAKGMWCTAWVSTLATAAFLVLYQLKPVDLLLSLAITAGTVCYHFWMRLTVGGMYDRLLHNRVDYRKKWFQVGKTEQKLYRFLKVKKWKKFLPTYTPDVFDIRKHSWNEIAEATCQSELVHETIVVFSFVPILFSPWLGAPLVFVLTSIASALFDLTFVMIQRFNRPRILKMIAGKRS